MTIVPDDLRNRVREIFTDANDEVTRTISKQPNIHEETLDHILINTMNKAPSIILPDSRVALAIDTHWLGGRRHFRRRWEIADIALIAVFRRDGVSIWRKVALLQSKRLYSKDIPVVELNDSDYRMGIGRLIDETDHQVPLFVQRAYSFDGDSVYQELRLNSDQVNRIDDYYESHNMPVYYSLYNPLYIPMNGLTPTIEEDCLQSDNEVGCRVVRSEEIHQILSGISNGPTFDQINVMGSHNTYRGWRIEEFVANEFLECHEGRRIEDTEDRDLRALLYERSAPISAAVVFTIDFPPDYEGLGE